MRIQAVAYDESTPEENFLCFAKRSSLYQEALKYLPGSYKLWYHLLKESRDFVEQFHLGDGHHEVVLRLHEKALEKMFNMPKIWIDYAEFAVQCQKPTLASEIYNRALKIMPVAQHSKVWDSYVDFALSIGRDED